MFLFLSSKNQTRTQATAMPHMYQSESVYAPYGPYAPYPVVIQPSPYRTPPPHLGSFLAQFQPPQPDALLQQLVQQMGQIIGLNNRATTLVITCLMNSAQIAGAQAATATVANWTPICNIWLVLNWSLLLWRMHLVSVFPFQCEFSANSSHFQHAKWTWNRIDLCSFLCFFFKCIWSDSILLWSLSTCIDQDFAPFPPCNINREHAYDPYSLTGYYGIAYYFGRRIWYVGRFLNE